MMYYWPLTKPNRPWFVPATLIRIPSVFNDPYIGSNMLKMCKNCPEKQFIMVVSNVRDYVACPEVIPDNVLFGLHVSSQSEYDAKVEAYMSLGLRYKVLSVFCNEIITPRHDWDWCLVSGYVYRHVNKMLSVLKEHQLTAYVEYYLNSRNVPKKLAVRNIPSYLVS